MSDAPRPQDRRRLPRARAHWPITLTLPDGSHEAKLRDVSGSGLCFFLDRAIPDMTVLQLQLSLPLADGDEHEIRAVGAVVRCERVSPAMEHYEVAVFLHELRPVDREALSTFVAGVEKIGTSD